MLSAAAMTLVAACTSPNPNLYTLAETPGTPRGGGPSLVLLHQVAVARYLERPEIVRSSEHYRLDVMANDAWGEPVAA
ncbi:MAG TPA: ABC-type transport auxiliary lipoprotein family protein, partial [Rhodopila sp.]|nr:ABC-type transport auxiliary lipoprotein family protein [Rhodopila sp.]